jgi:uncharacterized protein YjbI with pentapeptide repeats
MTITPAGAFEALSEAIKRSDNTIWNRWKNNNSEQIVFDELDFSSLGPKPIRQYNFTGVIFKKCAFNKGNFYKCYFEESNFECEIETASFYECSFKGAVFCNSNIHDVDFTRSIFNNVTFTDCHLKRIILYCTSLVYCRFVNGSVSDSSVFGVNAWNISLDNTLQSNLIVESYSDTNEKGRFGVVSVDDIELAQFINLILNNEKVFNVFNAMSSKIVLILGRFTEERKITLDLIRSELKNRNYSPIIFDFEKPIQKDLTGTILALSQMAGFIIADLTDGTSVPYELGTIIPQLRRTPLLPILLSGSKGFSMSQEMCFNRCVIQTFEYDTNTIKTHIPIFLKLVNEKFEELEAFYQKK